MNLDVARGEFGIMRSFVARKNFAFDGDNEFAARVFRFRVSFRRGFFADDNLRQTVTVTQVNKCENAEIAFFRDPAH